MKNIKIIHIIPWALLGVIVIHLILIAIINNQHTTIATQENINSELINQSNKLSDTLITTISWIISLISIIAVIVGWYSYQNFKLSTDQINQIRKDFSIDETRKKLAKSLETSENIRNQLSKNFEEIDKVKKDVDDLQTTLKNDINNLNNTSTEYQQFLSTQERLTLTNSCVSTQAIHRDMSASIFANLLASVCLVLEKSNSLSARDAKLAALLLTMSITDAITFNIYNKRSKNNLTKIQKLINNLTKTQTLSAKDTKTIDEFNKKVDDYLKLT